jgi:hypothetical protein
LAADRAGKLRIELTASRLVEIAQSSDIPIPGAREGADETVCARLVGGLGVRVFRDTDLICLEGHSIKRANRGYRKSSGNWGETPCYTFARLARQSPQPPQDCIGPGKMYIVSRAIVPWGGLSTNRQDYGYQGCNRAGSKVQASALYEVDHT